MTLRVRQRPAPNSPVPDAAPNSPAPNSPAPNHSPDTGSGGEIPNSSGRLEAVASPPVVTIRERWFSRRALGFHLAVAIWFPGCLGAGWWQVTVALSGDHLAYLYSVEWPVFALFGAIVWWHLIHDDPETTGDRGLRLVQRQHAAEIAPPEGSDSKAWAGRGSGVTRRREDEDEVLAAYNDFLEGLAAKNRPKTWRRT